MKILIAIALSCFSAASFAQHLEMEDYSNIIMKHKESFEHVVPGMYSKYLDIQKHVFNGAEVYCRFETEYEVLTLPNEDGLYEIQSKINPLEDCGSLKEGDIHKKVFLKKFLSVETFILELKEINFLDLIKVENSVGMFYIQGPKSSDPGVEVTETVDLDQSQFFNMKRSTSKNRYQGLLMRDFVGH